MSAPNRREILTCLAGTCALVACNPPMPLDDTGEDTGGIDTGPPPDPAAIPGGHVDDFRVGDLEAVGNGVAVGRDGEGYYALSTICTHRGCDMGRIGSVSSAGLRCDCHGSRFAIDGSVTRGPADDPLPFYPLQIAEDGTITIDTEVEIESDFRVPAPEIV